MESKILVLQKMVKGVIMRIQTTTVYKVENRNAYRTANPNYYLIVTDNEGEMLFTKSSIKDAKQRAKSNPNGSGLNRSIFSARRRYGSCRGYGIYL